MSGLEVLVLTGPGLAADQGLLAEITAAECERLGVPGRLARADAMWEELQHAGREERAIVALPGPEPGTRALMTRPGPHAARTVWYDIAVTGPAETAAGSVHQAGRGIWGLAWAIRHAVHRLRHPATRIAYGALPEQWAELRLPADHDGPPLPVAVLIHGGYWRSIWCADLMDAMAIDLAARGYAAWNLEYRRPDRHGWAATVSDVAAGVAAVKGAAGEHGLDPDRVAVLGHSAGGQLALRAAADHPGIALAVSLAGVVDLAEGELRRVGTGAVPAALGGTRAELPHVYTASDPRARLPLGVPQLIVQGRQDDLDLIDFNRRYAEAARQAGDDVVHLERPGDHFAVIDPGAQIWHETVAAMDARLRPGTSG
ncbi:acetyl esterase/lipase [Thermocatellispora tengchongensis]|uniref:Acetyl esterase/lipase n=1 Tax=Thermocatellispora tengchongensis TaxID=1073253 RepID=A0A840PH84_9ACTN|nr:alpha/beta hydrolase [Thermocatellispora tengchongensis]MBB5136890.1 acetyl esterase/lipase [Thermocatellispora tengchongensis]